MATIQASGNLFTWGRDTRYCLYPDNVVFYHPCDNYTEDTIQEDWDEEVSVFTSGFIVSGLLAPTESLLSYDNQTGPYPSMEGATSLAIAFWSKDFFNTGPDASILIGNSPTADNSTDFDNSIHLHGNNGKPRIHINGVEGTPGGSIGPTPNDSNWHFLVIYAEMSGGNWHSYASIDGGVLNYLTNDIISTTPMSGQRYNIICVIKANPAAPSPIIDEIICWSNLSKPFSDHEIINLYNLGLEHGLGMDQYFARGHEEHNGSCNLVIGGHNESNDSHDLVISGPPTGIEQSSGNLFVNGSEPRDPVSCPILDPEAAIQISDELIGIYQSRIDSVINQLGKSVLLEFTPERTPCTNCYFETIRGRSRGIYIPGGPRPFARGRQCPYCKSKGFLETPVQKCIRCLLRWNPKDAVDYGISVSSSKNVVRFKTYLYNYKDLVRAQFAISNYEIMDLVTLRVRRLKEPVIVGLREDRYCISFWESV